MFAHEESVDGINEGSILSQGNRKSVKSSAALPLVSPGKERPLIVTHAEDLAQPVYSGLLLSACIKKVIVPRARSKTRTFINLFRDITAACLTQASQRKAQSHV